MRTIVSRKISRGQGNELLNKLELAGLDSELTQRVIDSKENYMAQRMVNIAFHNIGGFYPTDPAQARQAMGLNFFGVEEARTLFCIQPTKAEYAALADVPFNVDTLMYVRDTHILVAVFPRSILEVRNLCKGQGLFKAFYSQNWYDRQPFANDRNKCGWYLVRKTPVDNSINESWGAQQKLLGSNEETPKAQVMIYTIIGHFKATGERLFEKVWVWCSDLDLDDARVCVGNFGLMVKSDAIRAHE